jgi:hypothetical protein
MLFLSLIFTVQIETAKCVFDGILFLTQCILDGNRNNQLEYGVSILLTKLVSIVFCRPIDMNLSNEIVEVFLHLSLCSLVMMD